MLPDQVIKGTIKMHYLVGQRYRKYALGLIPTVHCLQIAYVEDHLKNVSSCDSR